MLGKLIKHELKNTGLIASLLCVLTIVIGFATGIFFRIIIIPDLIDEELSTLLFILGITGVIIALSSINMAMTIYLVVHYYKSLYTSQGYLSFTLPATITEVVSSRIIVSCIWSILSSISIIISTISALFIVMIGNIDSSILTELQTELYNEFGAFENTIIATILVSAISSIMMYIFCISIGQLWSKHKILGAVLCYIVLRIVTGIILTIMNFNTIFNPYDTTRNVFFNRVFSTSIVYSIVTIIIFCVTSIYVSNKKLNLD